MGEVIPVDHEAVAARLTERWGEALRMTPAADGMVTLRWLEPARLIEFVQWLRTAEGLGIRLLSDITAADYLDREPRFEVVYHFTAFEPLLRLRVCLPLAEGEAAPSLCGEWQGANFSEREVFDMFGIPFTDHPNLERLLLPEWYEGYPLRRDHPLGDIPIEFDLPYRKQFGHA